MLWEWERNGSERETEVLVRQGLEEGGEERVRVRRQHRVNVTLRYGSPSAGPRTGPRRSAATTPPLLLIRHRLAAA